MRAGVVTSAIYNTNRDTKRYPEGFGALRFLPWRDAPTAVEPVLLPDEDAQSSVLSLALFGRVL